MLQIIGLFTDAQTRGRQIVGQIKSMSAKLNLLSVKFIIQEKKTELIEVTSGVYYAEGF
jgi:hypothetical protein